MAITKVGTSQALFASGAGSTVALTRTFNAINNLVIVAGYFSSTSTIVTISDTQTNTWVVANPDFSDATNGTRLRSWYCLAKNTSSTVITVTGTAAVFRGITLDEFTGNDTTSPLDAVNHSVAGATGTNPTGVAITLGANNCLVWSLMVDSVTAVGSIDGSTATKGADDTGGDWTEYRILSGRSGVSVAASWTSSGAYDYFIASFKPAVSATFVPRNNYQAPILTQ